MRTRGLRGDLSRNPPNQQVAGDVSHDSAEATDGDGFYLAGSYTHLYYLERDTTGKSEVDPRTRSGNFEAPSFAPDSGGVYTHQIGVLNVNAEAIF